MQLCKLFDEFSAVLSKCNAASRADASITLPSVIFVSLACCITFRFVDTILNDPGWVNPGWVAGVCRSGPSWRRCGRRARSCRRRWDGWSSCRRSSPLATASMPAPTVAMQEVGTHTPNGDQFNSCLVQQYWFTSNHLAYSWQSSETNAYSAHRYLE